MLPLILPDAAIPKSSSLSGLVLSANTPYGAPEDRANSAKVPADWFGPYMGFSHVEMMILGHWHELLPCGASTRRGVVQCPYHAWSYKLDGGLRSAPHAGEGIDPTVLGLLPVRHAVWNGWVFVNVDGSAPRFEEHLGGLTDVLAPWSRDSIVRWSFQQRRRHRLRYGAAMTDSANACCMARWVAEPGSLASDHSRAMPIARSASVGKPHICT